MNFSQKCIQGIVTLTLCMTMALPYQLQAVICCNEPCAAPYAPDSCSPCFQTTCLPARQGGNFLQSAGVFILGAGAGIGIGYAIWHNNHRHHNNNDCGCCPLPSESCDCCGVEGDGECGACCGHSLKHKLNLVFNVTLGTVAGGTSEAFAGNTVNLDFFVISPGGLYYPGTNSIPFTTNGVGFFESELPVNGVIVVCAECCGTYQIGAIFSSTEVNITSLTVETTSGFVAPGTGCGSSNFVQTNFPARGAILSGSFQEYQLNIGEFSLTDNCCTVKNCCKKNNRRR